MLDLWTDERVAHLKQLWASGKSAAQIAREMGCFSHCVDDGRSAVLGKVHRLKLPSPQISIRSKKRRCKIARALEAASQPEAPLAAPSPISTVKVISAWVLPGEGIKGIKASLARSETPDGTGIQIQDLTDDHCRWPKGNPREPDFEFCGRPTYPGMPYCANHCQIARSPIERIDKRVSTLEERSHRHGKTRTTLKKESNRHITARNWHRR